MKSLTLQETVKALFTNAHNLEATEQNILKLYPQLGKKVVWGKLAAILVGNMSQTVEVKEEVTEPVQIVKNEIAQQVTALGLSKYDLSFERGSETKWGFSEVVKYDGVKIGTIQVTERGFNNPTPLDAPKISFINYTTGTLTKVKTTVDYRSVAQAIADVQPKSVSLYQAV